MMFVYNEKEIKTVDKQAEEQGITLYSLMENAGRGLYEKLYKKITKEDSLVILCGTGNNGGDGIVLARYLKENGYNVLLTFPLGKPASKIAIQHLEYYEQQGFEVSMFDYYQTYDVIIDSLIGISLNRLPNKHLTELLNWCNRSNALKIAIDIPTGVSASNGEVVQAFKADITMSLHGVKPSAYLVDTARYFGDIEVVEIGLKQWSKKRVTQAEDVIESLPKRPSHGHKGTFGTSLLIAGSKHMPGSAVLSSIGAIRTGTGRLTVATEDSVIQAITPHVPEATFKSIEQPLNLLQYDALAIGPGINEVEQAGNLIKESLASSLPIIIDASALHSFKKWIHEVKTFKSPVILTPHPGEFSVMTGYSIKNIMKNTIELASEYATINKVIVVLKGENTVIAFPDGTLNINTSGNSSLAKGGTGDVLTGMLLSMVSFYEDLNQAVINAVYIHGLAAELWSEKYSKATMTASDFDQLLPELMKRLESKQIQP